MYRNSMLKGGLYMNIQKELSKGSSSLLVLSVLGTGDMYGYQIIKEIEQRSEFVFSFKEGTLYPILHGFEQEGLVKSYWQDGERGKRRKYYHITDRGLKMLNKSTEDWHSYSSAVEKVISLRRKNMDADFGIRADCRNRLAALSFRIVSLRHIIFGCVQRACRVRGDARCVARYGGGIPKGLQKNGACNGTVRRSVRFAVYYSRPAAALYLFGLC